MTHLSEHLDGRHAASPRVRRPRSTVQISKGRDYAFSGAVDALVIGDTTYDFEPLGVYATK